MLKRIAISNPICWLHDGSTALRYGAIFIQGSRSRICLRVFFQALLLLHASPTYGATDPLSKWNIREPGPAAAGLLAVQFANGIFVATGESGTIVTSGDGTNWAKQTSPVTSQWRDLAYGNGRFVAVGAFPAAIISSPDGTNWIRSTIPAQAINLREVTFGQGLFAAVDTSSGVLTSQDGIVWNTQPNSPGGNTIAYGNGRFVVVAFGSAWFSTDGTNWVTTSTPTVERLSFGNGLFVGAFNGSAVAVSTNGIHWTSRPTGFTSNWALGRASFDGSRFWLVSTEVLSSLDGTNWIMASKGPPASDVATGKGVTVLVGGSGFIATSVDGSNWVNQSSLTTDSLLSVTYGGPGFVASGSPGKFLTSSNGSSWNLISTPGTNNILKLLRTTNGYLAAAAAGFVLKGADYTNLVPVSTGVDVNLYGIAYGPSRTVAVGDGGKVVVSSDLSTWSQVATGTTNRLLAAAFGDGRFICVGRGGTILSSDDGLNFTLRTSPSTGDLADVTFGNGRFIAVEPIFVNISSNGVNWQRISLGSSPFSSIAYGSGRFALGSLTGTMRSSVDYGLTWTRHETGNSIWIHSVVFGNGSFVAAGEGGLIMQSDPVVLLSINRGQSPALTITGPRWREYQVKWSDRLPATTWNSVTNITTESETFTIVDETAGPGPRFYQAILSN